MAQQLQASFDALLRNHFHVVPSNTKRQDQWYKRAYQSWKGHHPDSDLLIITPFESREEWGPQLQQLAAQFSRAIEHAAGACQTSTATTTATPSETRLFNDEALDEQTNVFNVGWYDSEEGTGLTPAMQKLAFWTPSVKNVPDKLQIRARAIKNLIETEQLDTLMCLARQPKGPIKEAAHVLIDPLYGRRKFDAGWACMMDQVVQILFLVGILRTFDDSLGEKGGYQCWLPFVFSQREDAVIQRYMETHARPQDHRPIPTDKLQRHWEWCVRMVIIAHTLSSACGLPPIDWQKRVVDNFLYFLGFESFNRKREGQGYLGCDLNIKKDEKWLSATVGANLEYPERTPDSTPEIQTSSRQRDPLYLREAKQEPTEEPDEREQEILERLGDMETAESSYGLKRSIKYQRKGRD